MKKLTLLLGFLCLLAIHSFANVSKYYVDDAQINAKFASAVQLTSPSPADVSGVALTSSTSQVKGGDNATVAFVLCFFFGALGIHRAYLGAPMMILWYILTCGGIFEILWAVDSVLLLIGLINKDISKYVDNKKFFMWM